MKFLHRTCNPKELSQVESLTLKKHIYLLINFYKYSVCHLVCRYLPAGRIEKGETICSAAEREVLEETGLTVSLTTMLMVECARGSWIRFVLTGSVTGGDLKTPSQADKESLQAKWIFNLDELSLRAKDITHLVDRARLVDNANDTNFNISGICGSKKASELLICDIYKRSLCL